MDIHSKSNYKAWSVDINDFDAKRDITQQILFLIHFGTLAPSSHNSQPWRFVIKENTLTLYPEMLRSLPSSDTRNRELYISLGCALENILQAALYVGYTPELQYFPLGEDDDAVVRMTFGERRESDMAREHLAEFISKRHTSRSHYELRELEGDFVQLIESMGSPDVKVTVVLDDQTKSNISDAILDAMTDAMDDEKFREELSHYVKSSSTNDHVGMPGSTLGMPLPISYIAPFLIKRFNMSKANRKTDEKTLKKHTPMFVIISTRADDKKAWLETGRVYERLALEATKRGIATNPMAAPIEIGEHHKQLNVFAGIPPEFRAQFFTRVGYPTKNMPFSPRLPITDTIKI